MLNTYNSKHLIEKDIFVVYVTWKIYCLEKVAMFRDILPVKVTEVIKRCTLTHNVKRAIIITTENNNNFTLGSNNYFLQEYYY